MRKINSVATVSPSNLNEIKWYHSGSVSSAANTELRINDYQVDSKNDWYKPLNRFNTDTDIKLENYPITDNVNTNYKDLAAFYSNNSTNSLNKWKKAFIVQTLIVASVLITTLTIFLLYYFGAIAKSSAGEFCMSNYTCKSEKLLFCSSNVCACGSNYYFDQSAAACLTITTTTTTTKTTTTTTTTMTTTTTTTSTTTTTTTITTTTTTTTITTTTTTTTVTTQKRMNMYTLFTSSYNTGFINKNVGFNNAYGVSYMTVNGNTTYYIADQGKGQVIIIDASLKNVTFYDTKIPYNPQYAVCNPSTNEIYFSVQSQNMFKLSTSLVLTTNALSKSTYQNMYYDGLNDTIYIADLKTRLIRFYIASNTTFNDQLNVCPCNPYGVFYYNNTIYVGCDNGSIVTFQPDGTPLLTSPALCSGDKIMQCIYVDEDGYLAVPCYNDKYVNLYDVNFNKVSSISTGSDKPNCLVYDPFGRLIVTTDGGISYYYL